MPFFDTFLSNLAKLCVTLLYRHLMGICYLYPVRLMGHDGEPPRPVNLTSECGDSRLTRGFGTVLGYYTGTRSNKLGVSDHETTRNGLEAETVRR